MPTVRELLEREDLFDSALLRHGFVDYMRDYELVVSGRNGPLLTDVHRYLFIGCVEAHCETTVRPTTFAASLPDAFVYAGPDYPDQEEPDGFIWGVRWSCLYPGLTYHAEGARARRWTELLQRPMHEVELETEAFRLRLVFADVRYAKLGTLDEPGVLRPKDYPSPVPPQDRTSDGGVPGVAG
jgi:hypothetical protein